MKIYEADTILELKEQREGDFPYNRVRVVGPSPVQKGHAAGGEWQGSSAQGVIIVPLTGFAATLDEPYGKLTALYDVAEVPETVVAAPQVRVINSTSQSAGPTPEEVFAKEAPGEPSKDGKRVRTSPLDDPRPTKGDSSPLNKQKAAAKNA